MVEKRWVSTPTSQDQPHSSKFLNTVPTTSDSLCSAQTTYT